MLAREDIVAAYRFILRREPESETVIENWQRNDIDGSTLSQCLLKSTEFRSAYFKEVFPSRVIIFIHIPKTAGTALRDNWLHNHVKGNWSWLGLSTQPLLWEELRADPFLSSTKSLLGGHVHIADFINLNIVQPRTYLSVIRDPIDRVLSYYNFIKEMKTHPFHASLKKQSLLEALRSNEGFGKQVSSNEQLTYLFHEKKTLGARDNIVIGKQERVSEFIDIVNVRFSFESTQTKQGLSGENLGKDAYKEAIMEEPGYDEAVEYLNEKLAKEIEFYSRFDRVLELDAEQYNDLRKEVRELG